MKRKEYIKSLFSTYSVVGVLSEKNECKVFRLRNKDTGRDLVLRSFPKRLEAYETLCGICCENLPEIYDAIDLTDGQVLLNVMLTGKHPSEQLAKGRAGRIVRKCTAINPDERYKSALKLSAAL